MDRNRWEQIEQLFHSALEREERERAAFLLQACGGDSALREEVESLLAEKQGQGNLLSMPAPAMPKVQSLIPTQTVVPPLSESGSSAAGFRSLIGQSVGNYQILSPLGK